MRSRLVVVPCGHKKAWDTNPALGEVAACEAYTGAVFGMNRAYAEQFGTRWIILSAKYGFVTPESMIPGPYDVTFKKLKSGPVSVSCLRTQVVELGLQQFEEVIALGGKEYRAAVAAAFDEYPCKVLAPFAGLPIGKYMHAIKGANSSGVAFPGPGNSLVTNG